MLPRGYFSFPAYDWGRKKKKKEKEEKRKKKKKEAFISPVVTNREGGDKIVYVS